MVRLSKPKLLRTPLPTVGKNLLSTGNTLICSHVVKENSLTKGATD